MAPALAVVPPMSNESSRVIPIRRPSAAAAIAPLAARLQCGRSREDAFERQAAVAAHHVERRIDSGSAKRGSEPFEVVFHDRGEHCINDGCRAPLVLPVLRVDLRRRGHASSRKRLSEGFGEVPLVSIVGVRMQQADRDGRRIAFAQLLAEAFDVLLLERLKHVSLKVDAFAHGQPIGARNEWPRPLHEQIIEFASVLTADFDNVPKAVRRHENDARKLEVQLPEQRVCCNRRRMREQLDRRSLFIIRQDCGYSVDDRAMRLARRAGDFARDGSPAPGFGGGEIGERSADVDPDAERT